MFFARPDALTGGTLFETVKYAKPTLFFAVPRIYEKIEEKLKETFEKSTSMKKNISKYFYKFSCLGSKNRKKIS